MINLVLLSKNIKEQQILNMALTQQGLKVLLSEPSYQNFVFILQYMPDIILVELPYRCIDQLNFISRIRSYKRTHRLPIIGYGNKVEPSILRGMLSQGISIYVERPLKYSTLLGLIERFLKPFNKTIETKPVVSEIEKDIELIFDAATLPTRKIEAITSHIAKLLAFPFSIAKVLQITSDEKTGANHLAKAISSDPSISTHVLKLANSVFFASNSRRISSIKDAIVRIGFEETKKITMGMSVINLFSKTNKNLGFDRTDFWYHSLAVGLIAERLARNMGDINTEEAFLSGLMHDLGIHLLDEYFPSVFSDVLENTTKNAGSFFDFEKSRIGVTHLDVIGDLFPRWKIPPQITDAVTGQYTAANFTHPPESVNEKLAVCVALGNSIAKLIHIGRECDEHVTPVDNALMSAVKFPHGLPKSFAENIAAQIMTSRNFFGLEERNYMCECPNGIDPKQLRFGCINPDGAIMIPPAINFINHGIQCDTIPADTPASSLEGNYHVLLWWASQPPAPEQITPYTQLRQAPFGDTDHAGKIAVLLFCPDCGDSDMFPDCTVFNNAFDLRLLESSLAGMLTASVASLSPLSPQGAE